MRIATALLVLASSAIWQGQAHATTIGTNNVTDTLGPNFFFDTAAVGGGDTALSTSVNFIRDFGALGTGASSVSITGLGWAVGGNMGTVPSTLFASVSITFLGADNAVGGGDDQLFGTVADVYQYDGAGEYAWQFTAPLTLEITPNDTVNNFLLAFQGFTDSSESTAANLRFKTTSGTALSAAKLSVAGTVVAVPEPTVPAMVSLGLLIQFMFRPRR